MDRAIRAPQRLVVQSIAPNPAASPLPIPSMRGVREPRIGDITLA